MQTTLGRQPAQIGMSTVLLSIILLFIGTSVSWRIVQQTQQELARTESTVAFNVVENMMSTEGDVSYKDDAKGSSGTQAAVTKLGVGNDPDMLYLKKAETISIKINSENINSFPPGPSGKRLPDVFFNGGYSSGDTPRLLIRRLRTNASGVTEAKQVYICPNTSTAGCTTPSSTNCKTSSLAQDKFCKTAPVKYRFTWNEGIKEGDIIVFMMLNNDSYLAMKGLARHYRGAAYSDTTSNEARVIEQLETDESAPGLFQFGIMVNGSITY